MVYILFTLQDDYVMKKCFGLFRIQIFLFVFLLTFISISSCGKEEKKSREDLIFMNGLLYKKGSKIPFTGKEKAKIEDRILEYDVLDGIKTGEFKISYLDGKPQIVGQLVNNSNEGLWKYYYTNSQMESEGNFKNNLPDGKWTWYYMDGKLKEYGNFISGKREGRWTSLNEDGKIVEQKVFKDGKDINAVKDSKI